MLVHFLRGTTKRMRFQLTDGDLRTNPLGMPGSDQPSWDAWVGPGGPAEALDFGFATTLPLNHSELSHAIVLCDLVITQCSCMISTR